MELEPVGNFGHVWHCRAQEAWCLFANPDQADWLYLLANMQGERQRSECADFYNTSSEPQQFMIDVRLIPADYLTSQLQEAK